MAKSLQDHIKQRRNNTFIGRESQLELFKQNLLRGVGEANYYFIFNVHGQGGVGKTTLLQKFQEIAKEQKALVAYIDDDFKDIPQLLSKITKQLSDQGSIFKKFDDRYKIYLKEKKQLEADPEAPQSTWAFAGKAIAKGIRLASDTYVPGSGALLDKIGFEGIGEQIGEWGPFVKKKISNKDEVELLLNPVDVLTPIFLEEFEKITKSNRICCLFDVYENTSVYLDQWLRQVLDGKYGEASENLMLCISGRDPLNPNQWSNLAGIISTISLEPFTEMEARTYLKRKNIENPETIETILKISGQLPVLLEILAEKAPNSLGDLDDPCETAVERFLTWIQEPAQKKLALYAALPKALNKDVLKCLLPKGSDIDSHFDWLISNSFVSKRKDHWAYHGLVRDLMVRYLRQESLDTWAHLNGLLAEFYLQSIRHFEFNHESGWRDEKWRNGALEYHYHLLLQSPQTAYFLVLQSLAKVFRLLGPEACLPWCVILVEAEEICRLPLLNKSSDIRDGLAALIAKDFKLSKIFFDLLLKENIITDTVDLSFCKGEAADTCLKIGYNFFQNMDMEGAKNMCQEAISFTPDYAAAYNNLGVVLARLGDINEAIKMYYKAIELDPNDAQAYSNLGYELSNLGEKTNAIKFYEKAIEVDPNYAFAYGNLGYELYNLGEEVRAAMICEKAIELDPNNVPPYICLAELLSKSGDKERAILMYQKVLEIEQSSPIYLALGILLSNKGEREDALTMYKKAIELDPKYKATYFYLGNELSMNSDSYGAITSYQKALELDSNNSAAYFCLGHELSKLGNYKDAIKMLQTAIEIDPNNATYFNSLGWALMFLPDYEGSNSNLYKAWEISDQKDGTAAMNIGHLHLITQEEATSKQWYSKGLELFEDKEVFFNGMESDYNDLKMAEKGINRAQYDAILEELLMQI